jgi:TRAP-type C4-dicarboxylate transport system permease small subunit
MEFADGGMAFAKVPAWLCEAIIPFTFVVIAIRYILLAIINLKRIVRFRS